MINQPKISLPIDKQIDRTFSNSEGLLKVGTGKGWFRVITETNNYYIKNYFEKWIFLTIINITLLVFIFGSLLKPLPLDSVIFFSILISPILSYYFLSRGGSYIHRRRFGSNKIYSDIVYIHENSTLDVDFVKKTTKTVIYPNTSHIFNVETIDLEIFHKLLNEEYYIDRLINRNKLGMDSSHPILYSYVVLDKSGRILPLYPQMFNRYYSIMYESINFILTNCPEFRIKKGNKYYLIKNFENAVITNQDQIST